MQMRPYQYEYEDDDDDEDDGPGSSPRGEAAALVAAIKEIKEGLQPFIPLIVAKLGAPPNALPNNTPSAPPNLDGSENGEGNDDGGEPDECVIRRRPLRPPPRATICRYS
jgi:hypothetical protein